MRYLNLWIIASFFLFTSCSTSTKKDDTQLYFKALLDKNPPEVQELDIKNIHVVKTMKEGRVVHD